ncbi:MAG: hypothetical protein AAF790_12050, partial [Planctomycetota bacterium]
MPARRSGAAAANSQLPTPNSQPATAAPTCTSDLRHTMPTPPLAINVIGPVETAILLVVVGVA